VTQFLIPGHKFNIYSNLECEALFTDLENMQVESCQLVKIGSRIK